MWLYFGICQAYINHNFTYGAAAGEREKGVRERGFGDLHRQLGICKDITD